MPLSAPEPRPSPLPDAPPQTASQGEPKEHSNHAASSLLDLSSAALAHARQPDPSAGTAIEVAPASEPGPGPGPAPAPEPTQASATGATTPLLDLDSDPVVGLEPASPTLQPTPVPVLDPENPVQPLDLGDKAAPPPSGPAQPQGLPHPPRDQAVDGTEPTATPLTPASPGEHDDDAELASAAPAMDFGGARQVGAAESAQQDSPSEGQRSEPAQTADRTDGALQNHQDGAEGEPENLGEAPEDTLPPSPPAAGGGRAHERPIPEGTEAPPSGKGATPGGEAVGQSGPPDLPAEGSSAERNSKEEGKPSPPPPPPKVVVHEPFNEHSSDDTGAEGPRNEPSIPASPPAGGSDNALGLSQPAVTASQGSPAAPRARANLSRGSIVFVVKALETIDKSKEARKYGDIKKAAEDALAMAERAVAATPVSPASDTPPTPSARPYAEMDARVILEPLRLACATRSHTLVPTSIDCIGKLMSFDFFAEPDPFTTAQLGEKESMAEIVTNTVCDALTESADENTELQIVKALLMVVVSDTSQIHQGSLLKAVRTVYNIFLSSRSLANQAAAQASLTQMVHHVFSRIPRGASPPAAELTSPHPDASALSPAASQPNLLTLSTDELTTLQSLEKRKSFQAGEMLTPETATVSLRELYIKDAFLVLRTLCKLSMKALSADDERDPKSQGMKSKILSLHLIYVILKRHMAVFADTSITISAHSSGEQSSFIQAVKQYVFLSLSRNAVSTVNQVFQLAVEIFWLTLDGLRPFVKKELEVLLNEIFLPILEMRTATSTQKSILLSVLLRLCQNPQALVEVYINYDCDRSALENVYERFINIVSKISQTQLPATLGTPEPLPLATLQKGDEPGLAALGVQPNHVDMTDEVMLPVESHLKRQSLECLAAVLHSLVQWASRGTVEDELASPTRDSSDSADESAESPVDNSAVGSPNPAAELPEQEDDPSRLQSAKARKTMLLEGIRLFNEKPSRGIAFLVQNHFIHSSEPKEIARFLLYADGLNKARIGEYLGSGGQTHIATMHAFVDLMDFKDLHFLTALRRFLQTFRLPGEAQMIDRFMLKFAERYVMGNPGVFATADSAYIFAYSIVLLNTDAHNPQVKHRMSLQDFIRNNQGIDAGNSLSDDYQREVYESIVHNEIKMKDEVAAAPPAPAIAGFIASVGRDSQRAAYEVQSEGMASKTEALFRSMVRFRRRIGPEQRAEVERFFSASHMDHVKPMFQVAWMPILAGLSGPMQETSDMEIVRICLAAFKDAIHTSCLFDLELERNAFVTTLTKFTLLNNLAEMKPKHVKAIKCLLGIAQTEGNYLKSSWREVLACVSQLERFQLISGGVDENHLPDLGRRHTTLAAPARNTKSNAQALAALFSSSSSTDLRHKSARLPATDVVEAGGSTEVTVAADKVFSQTPQLSGTAIVDFVEALCAVSWEEIQSSGMAEFPRLFSLQKLVEISYYNMNRIRMEWSQIWAILGDHFNNVLVTNQLAISTFAVDSLRQLATKFLEKEELPGFAFQKDFLRPFAYAMRHSADVETREMIIDCLVQMVQARSDNIRSGWVSIFAILSAASVDSLDQITQQAFDMVQTLSEDHLASIYQISFVDLASCLASFAQSRSQRVSLQSVGHLRSIIPSLLSLAEAADEADESGGRLIGPEAQLTYWFPVFNALIEVVLRAADLEVRRVALDSLFELINLYASDFQPTFWDAIVHDILFAIFGLIRGEQLPLQEDVTVWLSTTMVQALRGLIELWTSHYVSLERYLPELLELLESCIVQENDTLARIGTSSLQQLLESNAAHFDEDDWARIVDVVLRLLNTTTPSELFDPMLVAPEPSTPRSPASKEENPYGLLRLPDWKDGLSGPLTKSERGKVFKQVIMRCVLQLLLIETVNELLQHMEFYARIPADQLLRLLDALQNSYTFAKRFNADKDLRVSLWRLGFMRQLPNLLRQESTAASTLVLLLRRMLQDERDEHASSHADVRARFIPLGLAIVSQFVPLDPATQARNIVSWMPVVAEIFLGVAGLTDPERPPPERSALKEELHTFSYYAPLFYPTALKLLAKSDVSPELLLSLRDFFHKAGLASGLCPPEVEMTSPQGPSPLSPVIESSETSTFPSRQQSALSQPERDPIEFSTDIFDVPHASHTTGTNDATAVDEDALEGTAQTIEESLTAAAERKAVAKEGVSTTQAQEYVDEEPSPVLTKGETQMYTCPAVVSQERENEHKSEAVAAVVAGPDAAVADPDSRGPEVTSSDSSVLPPVASVDEHTSDALEPGTTRAPNAVAGEEETVSASALPLQADMAEVVGSSAPAEQRAAASAAGRIAETQDADGGAHKAAATDSDGRTQRTEDHAAAEALAPVAPTPTEEAARDDLVDVSALASACKNGATSPSPRPRGEQRDAAAAETALLVDL